MLLSAALLAIAAVACAAAPAASWLIVGRFIGGLGVGLASVVSPLYISEVAPPKYRGRLVRSEEHTSELQSLMRISYAVFCLKKKKIIKQNIARFYKDTNTVKIVRR